MLTYIILVHINIFPFFVHITIVEKILLHANIYLFLVHTLPQHHKHNKDALESSQNGMFANHKCFCTAHFAQPKHDVFIYTKVKNKTLLNEDTAAIPFSCLSHEKRTPHLYPFLNDGLC